MRGEGEGAGPGQAYPLALLGGGRDLLRAAQGGGEQYREGFDEGPTEWEMEQQQSESPAEFESPAEEEGPAEEMEGWMFAQGASSMPWWKVAVAVGAGVLLVAWLKG